MSDTGTDLRPRLFYIEYAVLIDYDLAPHDGWLYVLIVSHVNSQMGYAFPSIATLAKETNMSRAQVKLSLKRLQAKNLIDIESTTKEDGSQGSNHYYVKQATKQGSKQWAKQRGVGHTVTGGGSYSNRGVGHTVTPNDIESFNDNDLTIKEKDSVTSANAPVTAAVETPPTIPATPDLSIGLSNPPPAAAPPPPKPRKVNPVFDAVAQYGFGIQPGQEINGAGGRIGKIVGWLKTSAPDTTPADLIRFYGWYQREYPGISAPRDVTKFGEHFTVWQQTAEAKIPNVGKIEGQQSLQERIAAAKARPVTLAWNSASDNSMEEI